MGGEEGVDIHGFNAQPVPDEGESMNAFLAIGGVLFAVLVSTSALSETDAPTAAQLSPEEAKAVDLLVDKYGCKSPYKFLLGRDLSHLGPTTFALTIGTDGSVKSATIVQSSGDRVLDGVGAKCIQDNWRYRPTVKDGNPIEADTKAQIIWGRMR